METKIENLMLKTGYVLVEPQPDSTSSFSSEHKKYERKSIGTIVLSAASRELRPFYRVGSKVVFDDAHSIGITAGGKSYEVLSEDDILGIFDEEEE
jgi:co-chaperonin GroES (HSP10)